MQKLKRISKDLRLFLLATNPVCEMCRKSASQLVHHIDNDPYNQKHNNLIALCNACHRIPEIHFKVKTLESKIKDTLKNILRQLPFCDCKSHRGLKKRHIEWIKRCFIDRCLLDIPYCTEKLSKEEKEKRTYRRCGIERKKQGGIYGDIQR